MESVDRERAAVVGEESPGTIARISWSLTSTLMWILCATTVMSVFARGHWAADLMANLRMQQLIGLLATFILCLSHRHWRAIVLVAVMIAVHLPWFSSVLAGEDSPQPDPKRRVSITLANVLTQNSRYGDVIADLTKRDPDVIAVLELNSTLAAKLDSEISQTYRHAVVRPQDVGNFGIGVYSKHPLQDHEVFELNLGIESIAATVTVADQAYRIFATHPIPPMGAGGYTARNAHLEQLAQRINNFQIESPTTSVVLVGDLNLTPWSPFFSDLEQNSGLDQARPRNNVTPTWYQFPTFAFGLILDHCLISRDLCCVSYSVGTNIGSDHRSVTFTLAAPSKP